MSNNSMGQPSNKSLPSIGSINQSGIQFANIPLQSPQLYSASLPSTSSQPSPMASQSQSKPSTSTSGGGDSTLQYSSIQIMNRPRLQELVREVDPTVQLDEEVEDVLLQMADDFIDTTLNSACALAKHRHASTVELKDVQLHLERQWNMWIPGFGNDDMRPYKRAAVTEAHKQRMALIRKTIKKY